MKKLLYLSAALISLVGSAQVGIHPQNADLTNALFFNKDSVFTTTSNIGSGNFKRMCLINPVTKAWKYTNLVDFAGYNGPFAMKDNMHGAMTDLGSNVYTTTDGWQTRQAAAGAPSLSQLVATASGYAAYRSSTHEVFFSATGSIWTSATTIGSGSGGYKLASSGNTVVMLKQYSQLWTSTDGGQTYTGNFSSPSFSGTFIDFVMYSPDTFYVLTSTTLYKSFNGGANWSNTSVPPTGVTSLQGLYVKSPAELYAWDGYRRIYLTKNNGTSWINKTTVPGAGFEKLMFLNNTMYAWPGYTSNDSCNSWKDFFPADQMTYAKGADIHFKGNTGIEGSVVGQVAYSYDKGRSFTTADTIPGASDITAVRILSNSHLLVSDTKGNVFYSNNAGQSWTKNYANSTNISTYKVTSSSNNDSTILLTRSYYPLISVNHGTTFTVIPLSAGGTQSQTLKPGGTVLNVVGVANQDLTSRQWQIYQLGISGAQTLIDSFSVNHETLIDIHMVSNNIGYLFTTDNNKATKVYKTTNGFGFGTLLAATIPTVVSNAANYTLGNTRIQNLGTDTLFLIGNGNTFYHYSYNGGISWTAVNEAFCTTYASLYPSIRKGYFFNANEYIYTLNNNGGLYLNSTGTQGGPSGIAHYAANADESGLIVYPNPSGGDITVKANEEITFFILYDMLGKKAYESNGTKASLTQLPAGLYILRAHTISGKLLQQKILINR